MSSETIWERVTRSPFNPFRMRTSDGKSYDVVSPEMLWMAKNKVIITLVETHKAGALGLRDVYISPLHVVAIEDLHVRPDGEIDIYPEL